MEQQEHDDSMSWLFLTVGPGTGSEQTEYRARREADCILLEKRIRGTWVECPLGNQPEILQRTCRSILLPQTQCAVAE